jgi:hypothetical protein
MLRPVNKQPPRLGGSYFQHWTKGPSKNITALSPGKWERWREDWVLVEIDTHERLMLSSAVPTPPPPPPASTGSRTPVEPVFNLVLGRI